MQNCNYIIEKNSFPSYNIHELGPFEPVYQLSSSLYSEIANGLSDSNESQIKIQRENFEKNEFYLEKHQSHHNLKTQTQIDFALLEQEKLFGQVFKTNDKINQQFKEINMNISHLKRNISFLQPPEANGFLADSDESLDSKENIILDNLNILSNCFIYELVIYSEFPNFLVKNRFFSFKIVLRDSNTKILVKDCSRIDLSIALFSSDDIPKQLIENKSGKSLLQNENDIFLGKNGEAIIKRIKINEVSSHFSNGSFIFCVYCSEKQSNSSQCLIEGKIDPSIIKPLIIQNIKVKSKK